eukprot:NODE_430_length_7576_cov_0.738665.p6 type:complete len:131 gc:universal NODE_430_length_7576_cov_0.738665:6919-7311(+)
MMFISFVNSAEVATCWQWAYYYYVQGLLKSSDYYGWISNCCVYGTQPSHLVMGVYQKSTKKTKTVTKVPLDIPDSKIDDGDVWTTVNEIQYNKHGKRVFYYMRANCASNMPFKPSTDNAKKMAACIDSYK